MTYRNAIHSCVVAAGIALIGATAPTFASAASVNMCKWDELPDGVVQTIKQRADYASILEQMFDACPESALSLTEGATGTIGNNNSNRTPDQNGGSGGGGGGGGQGGKGGND
ncbi:MAG: hypothetical protein AAGA28_17185 [Pseudomonadota bacterium]